MFRQIQFAQGADGVSLQPPVNADLVERMFAGKFTNDLSSLELVMADGTSIQEIKTGDVLKLENDRWNSLEGFSNLESKKMDFKS